MSEQIRSINHDGTPTMTRPASLSEVRTAIAQSNGRPDVTDIREVTADERQGLARRIRQIKKRRPWGERKHSDKLPGIPHNKRRS